MNRLLKPLWFLLALLFLLEAWLWDHLVPAIRRIVDLVPWRELKQRLADAIEHLSPQATLVVFLIPAAIYFGLELISLWPMANGHVLLGLAILLGAKIIGAAITAFTFDVTRDKLLQMDWFRRAFGLVIELRDAAHVLADPYIRQMRAWVQTWRPVVRARWLKLAQRLRRRMQASAEKR